MARMITLDASLFWGKTTAVMARLNELSPMGDGDWIEFTRSVTPEQINANREDGPLQRFGEVRQIDTESRTVELAFSSETPVERWFGEEILDHSPGAMRMGRIEGGAPLLVTHDWDDQIGVVERVWIGDDRRGRAKVRFGKSARAEEIWTDVVDGIRKHVSVGYRVYKVEVTTRKGSSDLIRVTDWEPYEISIVPIPADPTVGVGRSLDGDGERGGRHGNQQTRNEMKHRTYRDAQGNLVRVQVNEDGTDVAGSEEILERAAAPANPAPGRTAADEQRIREAATAEERERVRSITTTARSAGATEDFVRQHLERGSTVADFNAALLAEINRQRGAGLGEGGNQIGMSDQEVRSYRFTRLIRALANPTDQTLQREAAFEFECARAAEGRAHRAPKGTLVPVDVLTRAINTGTGGAAAGDTGGYLVPNTLLASSFVDMLRNRAVLMQLATLIGGIVGTVDVPKQTGGASGYWIGEDDEATLSAMSFGQFTLTPKTVAGMTEWTRRMMMQSSLDIEVLARRDLATALALALDYAGIYGSGTNFMPLGIANMPGINAVDFATASQPTYAELVKMETEIAADNADVGSMAYLLNARQRGHMKTTPKFASGTDQGVIWETGNTVNGYRTEVTNQMANTDTLFGNWSDLLIGMWGGLDITVDPFTHSARGRTRIVMMQDVDMNVRRAESFCLGRKS
ncbi:phage major capsid protein [Cereibacter sphaeroides]|uniref:phage major capsid protein n=2 Tax=Cereibacter sphaeroides TaxID=1063 RepID=UPI001FFD439D|nr:phage major capsid protein [Cereibacter sphaeroides]